MLKKSTLISKSITLLTILVGLVIGVGCKQKTSIPQLPDLSEFGVLRGRHFERIITHFHTPFSFDACDGNGTNPKNEPNLNCARGIEEAICVNRLGAIFFTDHRIHLAEVPYEKLLFTSNRKELVISNAGTEKGKGIAKKIHCKNGHQGLLIPGLEGKLLALGMTNHLKGDSSYVHATYAADNALSSQTLRKQTNAIIIIPHTESKSLELIKEAQPDGIEIYNFHANFDPTIREKYLSTKPYSHLFSFGDYIFDAYHSSNPNYLFLEFIEFFPIYYEKWNALIGQGMQLTGFGGNDAHQNVIAQEMVDGERLDSYRRMTAFMNHYVLVGQSASASGIPNPDFDHYQATKEAIKKGRVFLVIEGLGSPADLDFHSTTPAKNGNFVSYHEMGETVSSKEKPTLIFKIPHVYEGSPGIKKQGQPKIKTELIFINSKGEEKIVSVLVRSSAASFTSNEELVYPNPAPGAYRVRVSMVPSHLRGFVRKGDLVDRDYTWIVSNHIYVSP